MKNSGFTLIELLLYVAIFAMVAGMFTGILVIILRVEGQQSGLVEVSSQLSFAMNRIQSIIRESAPTTDPVIGIPPSSLTVGAHIIALTGAEIDLDGAPITTGKVKVDNLKFTKYTITNPSAGEIPSLAPVRTIEIEITISNTDTNPQNHVSRTLKSSASPIGK